MTPPTRIGHYELLESIGRDGPTEIFRARDLRLERSVAIKILREDEMARPGALDRFHSEARIASLVTHPHICAVHDSGEDDGRAFLVCELLEGRALDEAMAGAPLPLERALDVGIQIADALTAAHRRGVVHANLKPSNVFMTTDGHVKLLELGSAGAALIARATASPTSATVSLATTTVQPLGTATGEVLHAYLSPEQITGGRVDGRSDLFAVGALLYEMATGTGAFTGANSAEIASNITGRVPPRPRRINRKVPRALENFIERALEKAPERRYQDAAALLHDLRLARRALDAPLQISRWSMSRGMVGAASVAVLVLLAGAGWWWTARPVVVQRSSILVSQIANGTGEAEFDGTLREAIAVYLAQSPYLDLASDERINSALRLMGRPVGARITHDVANQVCQRLGLHAMIEGSVSSVGAATVVALVASDCQTGATIARRQVEVERKEEVLRALGQLTATLRPSLGETDATLARNNVPLEEATTPSLAALKAYTEAVAQRASGAELAAIKLLEHAIEIDRRFALAYTTLFRSCLRAARAGERTRAALHHVSVPRPGHGGPVAGARGARGLAARVSARLPRAQRVGGAAQSNRRLRGGRDRGAGGLAAQSVACIPAIEPRARTSGRGPFRRGACRGRRSGLARSGDRPAAAPALPGRCAHGRRAAGAAADRVGRGAESRIRCDGRPCPGRRVSRPRHRVAQPPHGNASSCDRRWLFAGHLRLRLAGGPHRRALRLQ